MHRSRSSFYRSLPSFLVAAGATCFALTVLFSQEIPFSQGVQAAISFGFVLLILLDYRRRRRLAKDEEKLKTALSFAVSSTRSADPEMVIVQGACRLPGVIRALLVAEVPGKNIEPLILASEGTASLSTEQIQKASSRQNPDKEWLGFEIPRWPSSPEYRILLSIQGSLSPERRELIESYVHLAGGYLASGTALRESSLAQTRLAQLEKQIAIARQRVLREARSSLMGKLVSNIAHELNNPLTAVLGSAQLLMQMEKDIRLKEILGNLVGETRRCKEIVDQVTGLAEGGSDQTVPVDLNRVLEEVFNLLMYRLRRERIELRKKLTSEELEIQGDEALLNQAFLNIGNVLAEILAVQAEPRVLEIESHMDEKRFVFRIGAPKLADAVNAPSPIIDRPGIRLSLWVAGAIFEEHGGKLDSSSLSENCPALHVEFFRDSKSPLLAKPSENSA